MRAFIYAVVIHIIFGALLGVSLLIQPRAVTPAPPRPVQAKAIDLAAIEREKQRIAQEKKKVEAEKKRKAEEKRKAEQKKKKEIERKKKLEAEKKKKAQAEKKRKAEQKKKKAAEHKKKLEAEKKKKAEAEKKRKAEEKRKAEQKKKKEAERKKKLETEKKKKAQAEKKRKAEAERKRKEAEKAKKAAEAKAQRERDYSEAVSSFSALSWAIQQQVSQNWSGSGDFSGLSVAFLVKVDQQGNVLSVKMTRSSGNTRLDESARNAIFKASPLPFPGEARFYEYLKEFNFIFKPES